MEKRIKVKIPRTPNFIEVGNEYQPLHSFTEEELQQIGKEWTDALIKKAFKKGVTNDLE